MCTSETVFSVLSVVFCPSSSLSLSLSLSLSHRFFSLSTSRFRMQFGNVLNVLQLLDAFCLNIDTNKDFS